MNETAFIIGNGKTTKQLFKYGFNNIPDNIDTYTTSLAYRFCEEINWWSTFYCFFDPKSVSYQQKQLNEHINDKNNPVKKWYLCKHNSWPVNIDDKYNKVEYLKWASSGNGALSLAIGKKQYRKIILIGLDNDYTWNHEWVEKVDNNTNRRRYIKTIKNHPDYFYPNYIRKGDIVSWDINKKISENEGRKIDLENQFKKSNIEFLNYSKNGNMFNKEIIL
jgi:hypothetical protein